MPLTFPPVSVVASGGIPVTNSKLGAPMTVVPTGKGLPITLTTKALGAPFYLKNPDGSDYLASPLDLGNSLLAWWTADRADTMTVSGGMVSSWRDVKNGYDATQGVSASRPTYQATGFGGSPCVAFDGTDDWLQILSAPNLPLGAQPANIYATAEFTLLGTVPGARYFFFYGAANGNMRRRVGRASPSNQNRLFANIGSGAASPTVTGGSELIGRSLLNANVGADTTVINLNGNLENSLSVVPSTTFSSASIGSDINGGSYWQGTIRDLIVTAPLTTDQATALTAYLLARRNV